MKTSSLTVLLQPSPPTYSLKAQLILREYTEAVLVEQSAICPITEKQLNNEVKGTYTGLVILEMECVEIVAQQSQSTKRLNDQQLKAFVVLYQILLRDYRDFFSASQHPVASKPLEQLFIKYATPTYLWYYGIYVFLELLRYRLPDPRVYTLSLVYLSYLMTTLVKENLLALFEPRIEWQNDLAEFRMAIEDEVKSIQANTREYDDCWDIAYVMIDFEASKPSPKWFHTSLINQIEREQMTVSGTEHEELDMHLDHIALLQQIQRRDLNSGNERPKNLSKLPCTSTRNKALVEAVRKHRIAAQTHDIYMLAKDREILFSLPDTTRLDVLDPQIQSLRYPLIGEVALDDFLATRYCDACEAIQVSGTDGSALREDLVSRSNAGLRILHVITSLRSTRLLAMFYILSIFCPVYGNETGSLKGGASTGQETEATQLVNSLLWTFCGLLILLIPSLGIKIQVRNCVSVISVIGFVAALATSVSPSPDFPNLWIALCIGTSIGASLLILRKTRAKTNTLLVAFARYVIPAAVIWQSLSATEHNEHGRGLDFSTSIPCLAVFGSVGANALLNQKCRETMAFLRWLRDQWDAYREPEGSEDDVV